MSEISKKKLLGITLSTSSKQIILEKIEKYISNPHGFFHIVSLNPEIMVLAEENPKFKKVIETAQIKIVDGIGIVMAAQILGIEVGSRLTGVDLMKKLVETASFRRLRVMLIGGKPNLAKNLAECYSEDFPEAKFKGIEGVKDIENPTASEESAIFSIVADMRPHIVFVSFGSPGQELWIERHKKEFSNMVIMGVGGAFDFLGGKVPRAPMILRRLGLEWFFRLMVQPWRWKRQLRLVKFAYLVFRQKTGI